jgi:hypothetical protein
MGSLSNLRAIDDRVLGQQPDEKGARESARLWWVFLVISAATHGVTTLGLFLLSSDVRFLILLGTAIFTVQVSFLAGFLFNNHLRVTGRERGGWPGYRVLDGH